MPNESYAMGPDSPDVQELTIGDALRAAAAERPQQIALVAGTAEMENRREWTYASLLQESEQAARALLATFSPGERVAVWAPNIPEWVIMEYACGLAGIIMVTVNPPIRPKSWAMSCGNPVPQAYFCYLSFAAIQCCSTLKSHARIARNFVRWCSSHSGAIF